MITSPPFGQADLTNCERELIHLTGSVQPHGVLLVLRPDLVIVQASHNTRTLLGVAAASLSQRPLADLGADLATAVTSIVSSSASLVEPVALQAKIDVAGVSRSFEGTMHRAPGNFVLVELEPVGVSSVPSVDLERGSLMSQVENAVQRLTLASTVERLADTAVQCYRELVGYDRVMIYRFDPDGHGQIIAEAREPHLESLLNHRYPATDIPQRARDLYVRNKLRVLVDVHYEPSPLEPRVLQGRATISTCR